MFVRLLYEKTCTHMDTHTYINVYIQTNIESKTEKRERKMMKTLYENELKCIKNFKDVNGLCC